MTKQTIIVNQIIFRKLIVKNMRFRDKEPFKIGDKIKLLFNVRVLNMQNIIIYPSVFFNANKAIAIGRKAIEPQLKGYIK